MATIHQGLPVDPNNRHYLMWDQARALQPLRDHFTHYVDRRGTGWRGYTPWLNLIIAEAIDENYYPTRPDPDLELRHPQIMLWHPGLHHRLVTHFNRNHRDHGRYPSHSMWVNLLVRDRLAELTPVKTTQLHLPGIPRARPRRRRQAHTPLGAPSRHYLT